MSRSRSVGIGVGLVLLAAVIATIALWPSESEQSVESSTLPSTSTLPSPSPSPADAGAADSGPAAIVDTEPSEKARKGKAGRGTEYLITSLRSAKAFRARARAAIVLGARRSGRVTGALIGALKDRHPAVRVAAVESLRRIGTPRAIAALRRLEAREADAKVKRAVSSALAKASKAAPKKVAGVTAAQPSPPSTPAEPEVRAGPRYYVGVSTLADPKRVLKPSQRGQMGSMLRGQVGRLRGVRLAPNGESSAKAKKALAGGATGYYLTASVTQLEYAPGVGVRAGVSLMVGTYPGRDMRAIVKGKVTLPGASDSPKSRDEAVKAAISSAVRKLPPTFARSKR